MLDGVIRTLEGAVKDTQQPVLLLLLLHSFVLKSSQTASFWSARTEMESLMKLSGYSEGMQWYSAATTSDNFCSRQEVVFLSKSVLEHATFSISMPMQHKVSRACKMA